MEKEFVSYSEALALKELGFDKPCFGYYNNKGELTFNINNNPICKDWVWVGNQCLPIKMILAPTFSQAFRWFREKYNLLGNVYSNASGWLWEIHDNIGGTHRFGSEWSGDCEESGMFTSFEKAELECLKKLIELVKNK